MLNRRGTETLFNDDSVLKGNDPLFWGLSALGLGLAITLAGVVRILYARDEESLRWKHGPDWVTLAVVYGLVAMVAATVVSATFPLLEARACHSSGFSENGDLVGQSSDRIFLGEPGPQQAHSDASEVGHRGAVHRHRRARRAV